MLAFNRLVPGQLILDGTTDGHKIHMQLRLVDTSKLMLVSRVNEYPYQH